MCKKVEDLYRPKYTLWKVDGLYGHAHVRVLAQSGF
jgi:hypothetical protein